jgi:hypothetical protein
VSEHSRSREWKSLHAACRASRRLPTQTTRRPRWECRHPWVIRFGDESLPTAPPATVATSCPGAPSGNTYLASRAPRADRLGPFFMVRGGELEGPRRPVFRMPQGSGSGKAPALFRGPSPCPGRWFTGAECAAFRQARSGGYRSGEAAKIRCVRSTRTFRAKRDSAPLLNPHMSSQMINDD